MKRKDAVDTFLLETVSSDMLAEAEFETEPDFEILFEAGDTFEIYFSDLTEEAKERYLGFLGVESGNFELAPLAVIERPEIEEL